MNRPVHFEIPSDDPEKAATFYAEVFGWTSRTWGDPNNPYWLVSTGEGNGIDGGILKKRHPGQVTTNTMDVEDVDAMTKAVQDAGGTVVVPKMAIPSMGWLVYCADPDGNVFGMMQMDSKAI